METKPFFQSSEFWVSLVTGLYMFFNTTDVLNQVPPRYAAIALAVVTALYTLARGQAKSGVPYSGR